MAGVLSRNVSEMKRIRDKTKIELDNIADSLWRAHDKHNETQSFNAHTSLASNIVGLSGLLIAPFSGGLSLIASAAATGGSVRSMLSNYCSCERLSAKTKEAFRNTERAMREYNSKLDEIENICKIIVDIDTTTLFADVVVGIHYTISKYEQLHRKHAEQCDASSGILSNITLPVGVFGLAAFIDTHTAEVTKFTQTSVLENTSSVSVYHANLTYASKGIETTSCTTAESVCDTKVKGTSKVTKSAAGVCKLGLAFSALAIPMDIYNIITINNTMVSTPENVKKLRDQAKTLGDGLEKIYDIIQTFERMHMEVFKVYEDYHVKQTHGMFTDDKKCRVKKLYDFLELCHQKLKLKHPTKYS